MKKVIKINNKNYTIPSFFWISNLGGGGSDKYRETVYLDLYNGIPTLYNYYYLKYPSFATKWLSKINNYKTFGDFLKFTRNDMINAEHFICKNHNPGIYNYNENIYLLDSGARNILNDIIRGKIKLHNSIEETMVEKMYEYYDFANRFKFDFVIGYDLGGKYTFKDSECSDERLKQEIERLTNSDMNKLLFDKTIEYLINHPNYYPKVYATVHGKTPNDYKNYINYIVQTEKEKKYEFFGYALGGVASSKNVDDSWFVGFNNKELKNTYLVTTATKIVKSIGGNKPIHVLGGGNKDNIPTLIFNGATSFDCQTPGRRAYDGNNNSSLLVYDNNAKVSFSKYIPGLFDNNLNLINTNYKFDYYKINQISDTNLLCGCPACSLINNTKDLKKLYSMKNQSDEYYYYARQIMNIHSIWQHCKLTNLVSNFESFDKLIEKYPLDFFKYLNDNIN